MAHGLSLERGTHSQYAKHGRDENDAPRNHRYALLANALRVFVNAAICVTHWVEFVAANGLEYGLG